MIPTIKLMAATWAGLIRDGDQKSASQIEGMGKAKYGEEAFGAAMAESAGGGGIIGETGDEADDYESASLQHDCRYPGTTDGVDR